MAARRLVIVMLVMLAVASVIAALAPVEIDENEDEPAVTAPVPAPAPGGTLVRARIDAEEDAPEPIELRVGDQLALTVHSRRPDEVEIPAIGELRFAGPFAPARFDFLAWEEATYAVRLVEADRVIGRIEVGPPRRRHERSGGD